MPVREAGKEAFWTGVDGDLLYTRFGGSCSAVVRVLVFGGRDGMIISSFLLGLDRVTMRTSLLGTLVPFTIRTSLHLAWAGPECGWHLDEKRRPNSRPGVNKSFRLFVRKILLPPRFCR